MSMVVRLDQVWEVYSDVVDNADAAVAELPRALKLDRRSVRRRFEKRFSVKRMAREYVALYGEALRRRSADALACARPHDASTGARRGLSTDTSGNGTVNL